jgi:AcrR family transcriptional regulator
MDDESGTGLPASVQAAWGLRERPAKGPKPALSLDRIIEAAVRIAQADGLPAVSMSRVAAEVGATAMALYRYVGKKDELLALMVDAALGEAPAVPHLGQSWREGLTEWAWAENEALRRHPWALRIPIAGIPALPNQFSWMESGLRCLREADISQDEKLSVILLVSNVVRGYAMLELDLSIAMSTSGKTPDETMASYGRTFSTLATPERFPALALAFRAGVLDKADPPEKEFIFGLERVLDGIAVLTSAS